jgi:hypothetical protein
MIARIQLVKDSLLSTLIRFLWLDKIPEINNFKIRKDLSHSYKGFSRWSLGPTTFGTVVVGQESEVEKTYLPHGG